MEDLRVKLDDNTRRSLLDTLRKRHHAHLRPGEVLECDSALTHGEAWCELVLRDPKEEQVLRLQARVDLVALDIQDPTEGRDLGMDLLDLALQEYFSTDRSWVPTEDWKAHLYEEREAWIRGRLRNLKLERQAADLLGEPLEPDFEEP